MKGDTRWLALGLALVVLLALLIGLTAAAPEAPPLSIRSDDRDGVMALQLWLQRSGYDTREVYSFSDMNDFDVLFVLQPLLFAYSQEAGETLRRWVSTERTLIIAGTPETVNPLLSAFGVNLRYLEDAESVLSPSAPTLLAPPFDLASAEAMAGIESERDDLTPHLSSGDVPILTSFRHEGGQVWVSGALRPFTNSGLHDPGSASIIANLLASVPRGARIGFDEGGHGFSDPAHQSLAGWLLSTAPGWGVLGLALVTLVFLASSGRRFGRALPLPEERLRRESVEYIQAIGSLFRRSGERTEILKHYNEQVRRRLSERYAIDPGLEAMELVKAVVYRDPSVDENDLRALMQRLAASHVSEHALIEAASAADDFLRSLS